AGADLPRAGHAARDRAGARPARAGRARLFHDRRRSARQSAGRAAGGSGACARARGGRRRDARAREPAGAGRGARAAMSVARAPGKLVLSGAYSVLYGAPALVAAVDRYVSADSALAAERVTPEVRAALGDAPAPGFDASALRRDGK